MLISVIIPHLNQPEALEMCLASIRDQEGVSAEVEIIVADNGSRSLPTEICARFERVALVSEPTPGPGPARNRGVAEARGDLYAFIDADCTAAPGWLAAIEASFADPEAEIIGGDVRTAYADPDAPHFIEPYEAIYSYRNEEHIAEGFSGTGNLATRPAIMQAVGPFAGIEVAEDRDWGFRAGALGYTIRYVPEMAIYHPARKSYAELTQKWDRHIAHDYEEFLKRPLGRMKWALRALAMAVSPLAEIPRILTSPRVRGAKERLMAFRCLVRIRLYRMRRMFGVLLSGRSRTLSGGWNR